MAATQRAYTMDELKSKQNPLLTPDVQYYLAQQVHPVVSRLCELLEGIDGVRIAEFLGIQMLLSDDHDSLAILNGCPFEIVINRIQLFWNNCRIIVSVFTILFPIVTFGRIGRKQLSIFSFEF